MNVHIYTFIVRLVNWVYVLVVNIPNVLCFFHLLFTEQHPRISKVLSDENSIITQFTLPEVRKRHDVLLCIHTGIAKTNSLEGLVWFGYDWLGFMAYQPLKVIYCQIFIHTYWIYIICKHILRRAKVFFFCAKLISCKYCYVLLTIQSTSVICLDTVKWSKISISNSSV